MKRVTIELPDDYADGISISAIGYKLGTLNIATSTFDISKGENLSFDGSNWKQEKVGGKNE